MILAYKNKITSSISSLGYQGISVIRSLEYWMENERLPFQGVEIYFYENLWDFRPLDSIDRTITHMRYDFNFIDVRYVGLVKGYILKRILVNDDDYSTLYEKFRKVKVFVRELVKKCLYSPQYITLSFVKKYLSGIVNVKEETKNQYYEVLRDFLVYLMTCDEDLDFSVIFEYMNGLRNNDLRDAQRENGKTATIHHLYLDKMIQCAISDINDEDVTDQCKINASIVVLLSQIGCRISELRLIQANSVANEVIYNNITVSYMRFKTFKTVKEKEFQITETYMNSHSLLAYETLQSCLKDNWSRSEEQYLFYNPRFDSPLQKITLRNYICKFVLRHYSDLRNLEIDNEEFDKYGRILIHNENSRTGLYVTDHDRQGISLETVLIYPKPHQFRVAVVNNLADNPAIDLDMIRSHMNHLTTDMTEHYIRRKKKKETISKYTSLMIQEISLDIDEDISKMHYTLKDKAEEFIASYKHNIGLDIKDIIEEAKNQLGITEKSLGYCISNPLGKICSLIKFENIGYDTNNINMISFKNIGKSYQVFKNKIELINYNKKNGFRVQSEIESKRLKKHIESRLIHEIDDMNRKIDEVGLKEFTNNYPRLSRYAISLIQIENEVLKWKN